MRRFLGYFVVANLIGIVFLWLTVRELPVGELVPYLRQADTARLLLFGGLYLVLYGISHWARIWRWSHLVEPLGEDVEKRQIDRVCAVGLTAIFLLPLRLGELVRPYLLGRKTKISASAALGTAVVERVIDGLLMTGLMFAALLLFVGTGEGTGFAYWAGGIGAAIFVPTLLGCVLVLRYRSRTLSVISKIGTPISESLTERVCELVDKFIQGFEGLRSSRSLGQFMWGTAVYWGMNVLSMWVLARYGFELDVGLIDVFVIMPILIVGIMIPAGPAQAGNFEYFLTNGFGLFVPLAQADIGAKVAIFAPAIHILQFIVIVIPGFFVMWTEPKARHLVKLAMEARHEFGDGEQGRD